MVEPKTQRDKEINGWFEGSVWSESAHLYFDPETEYNPDDLSDEEKTERGWTLNSFYKKWEPPKPKKEPDPVKMPPVEQLDLALQTMARKDPVFFNEYILRDEQSGKHIQLAKFQKALAEVTGQTIQLEFQVQGDAGKPESDKRAARTPNPQQRLLEIVKNPMVHRASELFGAQPIRVDDPPDAE